MNVFTAIIELRSSCQMVSSKLRELEHDIKNKSEGDFGTLENAVYFMNKSISLVQMLGVDGENQVRKEFKLRIENTSGVLKQRDLEVFSSLRTRLCEVLKVWMEQAIQKFNDHETEDEQTLVAQMEERVKRISHMFK